MTYRLMEIINPNLSGAIDVETRKAYVTKWGHERFAGTRSEYRAYICDRRNGDLISRYFTESAKAQEWFMETVRALGCEYAMRSFTEPPCCKCCGWKRGD